uniref:Uncharacterized protein n=1 Tax=Oryza meridionalis TaxID=40149 RepID=A0A0E0DQT1_9ORYZ
MSPTAPSRTGRALALLPVLVPSPPLLLLVCSPVASAGEQKGVCVSPGGRFPAFSSEGEQKGVCVSPGGRFPAFSSEVRKLASTGEGSLECLHLWELLECSICDPRVGVRPGPPVICASFCDMVFEACSEAYFAIDVKKQCKYLQELKTRFHAMINSGNIGEKRLICSVSFVELHKEEAIVLAGSENHSIKAVGIGREQRCVFFS